MRVRRVKLSAISLKLVPCLAIPKSTVMAKTAAAAVSSSMAAKPVSPQREERLRPPETESAAVVPFDFENLKFNLVTAELQRTGFRVQRLPCKRLAGSWGHIHFRQGMPSYIPFYYILLRSNLFSPILRYSLLCYSLLSSPLHHHS